MAYGAHTFIEPHIEQVDDPLLTHCHEQSSIINPHTTYLARIGRLNIGDAFAFTKVPYLQTTATSKQNIQVLIVLQTVDIAESFERLQKPPFLKRDPVDFISRSRYQQVTVERVVGHIPWTMGDTGFEVCAILCVQFDSPIHLSDGNLAIVLT